MEVGGGVIQEEVGLHWVFKLLDLGRALASGRSEPCKGSRDRSRRLHWVRVKNTRKIDSHSLHASPGSHSHATEVSVDEQT